MKTFYSCLLLLFINVSLLSAQSVFILINNDYTYMLDRYEIKSDNNVGNRIFSAMKPYLRKNVAQLADTLLSGDSIHYSKIDKANLKYLQDDNWEDSKNENAGNGKKPFLKKLYEKKNDFYQFHNRDFEIQVNPVLDFSAGREKGYGGLEYLNTRGVEIRGSIDQKIGFYTYFSDNQAVFPVYVRNEIKYFGGVVPGNGVFDDAFGKYGYDFFDANGYITFNFTKHINFQIGHDKNFIGNGYRSLFLSDFSGNYFFAKITTNVWKLQYTNIFAKLGAFTTANTQTNTNYEGNKYMALNYLSVNITRKITIGFFESVTFGKTDSLQNRDFDPNYLDPVIFTKWAEDKTQYNDKAHLGFDWKWNFLKHFSYYGQVFIDDILVHALLDNTGSWVNTQAFQNGIKYIDVAGIKNLDMQLESNIVKPYTYTHTGFSQYANYSNYSNYTNDQMPLADPYGANFYEWVGILRYQPHPKVSLTAKGIYTIIGLDSIGPNAKNYGSNIFLDYLTHVHDNGNTIAQGYKTHIEFVDFTVTWQVRHNLFIDFKSILRNESSELAAYNSKTVYLGAALRWNIAQRLNEY